MKAPAALFVRCAMALRSPALALFEQVLLVLLFPFFPEHMDFLHQPVSSVGSLQWVWCRHIPPQRAWLKPGHLQTVL